MPPVAIGSYYAIPLPLQRRFREENATIPWLGDSLSSQFYKGDQSTLFWGFLDVFPGPFAGFSTTYSTGTGGANAHALNLEALERTNAGDNTHNGMGNPGVSVNDAGDGAFSPLYMLRVGFTASSSGSNNIWEGTIALSPELPSGGSWWVGLDDFEAVCLVYQDANTPTGFDVRLLAQRGGANVNNVDVDFGAETSATNDGPGIAFVANPADPSSGLSSFSFPVADSGANESEGLISFAIKQDENVPASDFELTISVPFFHSPTATGLRLWNVAFGGWDTEDHERSTGTVGTTDRFFTNTAIEQFLAHVDEHMPPANTLVIAMGTNDTITDVAAHKTLVKSLIERWATRMDAYVPASDIMVLIITPYRTDQSASTVRDVDAWESIADDLIVEGTATVAAENIGFVKISKAINDVAYNVHDPAWDAGDGTHISPAGAQGLGQIISNAITASSTASRGRAGRPGRTSRRPL